MSESLSFDKARLSEEEIAAIATVLAAASRQEQLRQADDRPLAGGWKSYYRTLRPTLVPGREAWRTYHRL
ncbi:MAG: acyl-CoA carboxylase subunit epsilon [Tessaracoccus sp.]|uniref:acyl-CoA carboxylase epsilon subunit n=1 Tax=Tessaracoccus sp. TaxID=1971211 RepID=UPI001ECF0D03|nr:acyl-CoA carboxylase epsilon subunit [Tessaracoccus sp.]MBK7821641.1 acyl-CoA carboxylase subunit epsilon [Tessaracoccus sp.]